jgi:hypothetical protein
MTSHHLSYITRSQLYVAAKKCLCMNLGFVVLCGVLYFGNMLGVLVLMPYFLKNGNSTRSLHLLQSSWLLELHNLA